MLGEMMLTGIDSQIYGTDVVTHHTSQCKEHNPNASKQFPNPNGFSNCVGNSSILNFNRWFGNHKLLLRAPSYNIGSKENCITYGGTICILATSSICIRIGNNQRQGSVQCEYYQLRCRISTSKLLHNRKMRTTSGMHKLGNYINCICNVNMSHDQVLQCTYRASVLYGVCK